MIKVNWALVLLVIASCGIANAMGCSRVNLDCNGNVGCALDKPFSVVEEVQNSVLCALECAQNQSCVNFNFLYGPMFICQLYNYYPYKIEATISCSNFDLIHRMKEPEDDGNHARHKRTCQSSDYGSQRPWYTVDDDFSTNLLNCAHTNNTEKENNWFMVDLQYLVVLSHIRILARIGNLFILERYRNLTIGVTNNSWLNVVPKRGSYHLCGVYLGPLPNASWIQIDCFAAIPPARYVIVHQVPIGSKNGGFLSICEFQAFGKVWKGH